MPHFTPVPAVDVDPDLRSGIEQWALSAPMRALVKAFDGDWTTLTRSADGLSGYLSALDTFSERWDIRFGRERNFAYEPALSEKQVEIVIGAADALGLRSIRPPRHRDYDHVLLLGGMFLACFTRSEYAAGLIRTGTVRTKTVTALGTHRPFGPDEFLLAAAAGLPELADEYEALDACTRLAFGLADPEHSDGQLSDTAGGAWSLRRYRFADGTPVAIAAVSWSEPFVRRAKTSDVLTWFAERVVPVRPGQRILMVTTPIYVPTQHAAALRTLGLPYRVEIDTVGYDPQLVPPPLKQPFSPSKYLLEVRSSIRALRDLLKALDADAP